MENNCNKKKIESFGVVICALNEAEHIEKVVRTTLEQNPCEVVVIDDGSVDQTAELAEKAGATVLRNSGNRGKGASLKRGFEFLSSCNCDAVIVLDGDGHHNPAEIGLFLDAYERTNIPILIGNRMADTVGMPMIRQQTNNVMAWILNRLVKIYVPDPPCGYRFYRTDILPYIMSNMPRFAFEFDIIVHAARRHVRIDSVRISTIYNKNRRSHVSPLRDTWWLLHVVGHHFFINRRERKYETR